MSDILPEQSNQPNSAELREQITNIASRYRNFQCVECAQAIKEFLSEQSVRGKHIKIYTGTSESPYGYIYHDRLGENIATNGRHEGILVVIDGQQLVFDNIEREGVTQEVWLQNLYSPILDIGIDFQITEENF